MHYLRDLLLLTVLTCKHLTNQSSGSAAAGGAAERGRREIISRNGNDLLLSDDVNSPANAVAAVITAFPPPHQRQDNLRCDRLRSISRHSDSWLSPARQFPAAMHFSATARRPTAHGAAPQELTP